MIEQFYQDLLPPGQKVVATIDDDGVQHYVVESTDDLVNFLTQFEDKNTYHSLGGYEGLQLGEIHEVKHLAGCVGVRAWGFDLDVGDEPGKYEDLEQAFTALSEAVQSGKIPEPRWVLYSGGGLQFYFVQGGEHYENGLPEEMWAARFLHLKQQVKSVLKMDPTVGSHPYRLLRSPCSPNWKYVEPVWPQILSDEPGPLLDEDYFDNLAPITPTQTKRLDDSSLNVERPVGLKNVLKACAAMAHEFKTQGQYTLEPKWLAVGNICAHTREFRKGYHVLSQKHPNYSQEETDSKFAHIIQDVAAGPMGCFHFGDVDDPESPCHNCWAAKIGLTNPVSATRSIGKMKDVKAGIFKGIDVVQESPAQQLDTEDQEPEQTLEELVGDEIPDFEIPEAHLPDGFEYDEHHIFDESGLIMPVVLCNPLQYNRQSAEGMISFRTPAEDTLYHMPARKLAHPASCAAELMNAGIHVMNQKKAMQYMQQATLNDVNREEVDGFGWGPDFENCLLPSGSIGPTPLRHHHSLDALIRRWAGQSGELDKWLEAVSLYERPGQEPYLMALLASLASPMMSYFRLERGVILCLTGPGGTGKTTALNAASSVWGKSISTLATMTSSEAALRRLLSMCGNMPMIFDEMTQLSPTELKSMALEISQGIGRERATPGRSMAASEVWHLAMICTSNTSVHQRLAELLDGGNADMNRVLELPVMPSANVSLRQGGELLETLSENYGWAGQMLIEEMMTWNLEVERSKFKRVHRALREKDQLRGSDRFADCLIMACYWAHKTMKSLDARFPGDPEQMFVWMRTQLLQNNRYIQESLEGRVPSVEDFLLEYTTQNLLLTPAAGKGYMSQGQTLKGYIYDKEDIVIVPKSVLSSWAERQQLKLRTVIERWGVTGRLVNHSSRAGLTRWTSKYSDGLVIDGKKKYPNVLIIKKLNSEGQYGSDTNQSSTGSGKVTTLKVSAKANR